MKRTLIKVTLAALAVVMLGSCEKINQRIDALEERLDGIETEKIASIDSQIASINSSIADLGTIRSNITSLRSQVDDHSTDIFNLEEADRALNDRILNLEDYLDDVLPTYAEKDWVKATFSTLAQYEATCDTIAKIDARIGKLDERLSKEIKACADSMKRWVNVQFSAYYTAAEMDAALEYMQAEIDSLKSGSSDYKLDSLANELTKTKAAVDSAKAQLTREYKAAIDTAITHLEGNFDRKLQQEIEKVNADITALTTRVSNLEVFVATLTGRVTDLEGMIQSVTIVPAYSDGSVEAKGGILYLDIIVEPATAVAGLTKDKLKVLVNEVKTKAVSINTVEVADIKVDVAKGTITARANISSKLPVESGKALTIAVNVKNGLSDYTTEFCPVFVSQESNVTITDKTDTTQVTIQSDEAFPKSSMGNIGVEEGFKESKSTSIEMGGIGTVTFDNTATSKIKANAENEGSTNVFFKVEDVTESKPVTEANIVYEVTMKTVDEKGVEVFAAGKAAGKATVTVPLGEEVKSVQSVSLVDESGRQISGGVVDESVNFENGILTFQVNHFSRYAIKYTLKENVAQIDNQKFTSLANAIAAAQEGNTIQLLCDCMDAEGIVVPEGKKFTLDFGGHTYKVTKDLAGSTGTKNQCFQLLKGSTLVFQNGTITTSCAKLGINSYSDLVVKDVKIDMSQTSATGQVACFETCNGTTSLQGNTSLVAKEGQIAVLALYWPNGGYGDINVELNTTGEVKGLMAYGSYEVQELSTVAQHSHVAIKNGKYDVTFDMDGLEKYDFKIYGGVFEASPDTVYLAPNYMVVSNTDPETKTAYPYRVQQKPPVVKIGDKEYADIADAFAAVPTDGTPTTVTLLENIGSKNGEEIVWKEYDRTFAYTVNDKQNITFDLNGKKIYAKTTVNGYTGFLLVKNGGSLTIKDSAEGGELNYLDGKDNEGGLAISSEGKLTIESGTIENHTVCVSSAIQGAIDVHANEWGTPYTHHVTFTMNGGVLKSQNDNTLRIYDSSQTGKGTVVFDFEINGGEIYGADAVFIMTQWTKTYCTDDTYMNNINVNVKGGKFVTKNGIRVVGNVGDDNNKDYKAIKINVSGGEFTILANTKYRENHVAFQESAGWTSTEVSTQHLRSYTEVTWTAADPTYSTPAQQ